MVLARSSTNASRCTNSSNMLYNSSNITSSIQYNTTR